MTGAGRARVSRGVAALTTPDSSDLPLPRLRPVAQRLASTPLGPLSLGLFALAYLAAAEVGRQVSFPAEGFTAFWPPAALFLVALLLRPRRDWLWIAVAGVLPANLAFDLVHGRPFVLSLAFVVANTASAAFGAQLLSRAGSPGRLFASARRSLRTFLLLVVVPLPGAAIGSLALERLIGHSIELVSTAATWWASDLLALYVIVPLLVVVRETRSPLDRRRRVEGVAAFAALFAISFWLFGRSIPAAVPAQHPFWLIPVLVWIGLRFGRRGAGLATFLLALVASWGTAQGFGSFAANASRAESAVVLQMFLCVSSAIAISLAASMRSRESSIDELRRQRSELQQALDEIRTLRGLIPICAHCRKLRDDAGLWQSLERYLSSHTEAQLTHGLCPQCLDDLYPELHGDD